MATENPAFLVLPKFDSSSLSSLSRLAAHGLLSEGKKPAEKEFAKKMKSDDRRQIKYWAKTNDFTATHAVLGNYVLFIVTKQHPYYMVETHDAVMAQNLRELFKGFWDKI